MVQNEKTFEEKGLIHGGINSSPSSAPLLDFEADAISVAIDHELTPPPSRSTPEESTSPMTSEEQLKSLKVNAGVASGLAGLLICGPILAILLGFGAAYAVDKDGPAGDISRAVGEVARSATLKAKEVDKKHHIVDQSKVIAQDAWQKAREVDEEHQVLERGKSALEKGWDSFVTFVQEHNLLERGVQGVGKGLSWTAEQISQRLDSANATPSTEHDFQRVPTTEEPMGKSSDK